MTVLVTVCLSPAVFAGLLDSGTLTPIPLLTPAIQSDPPSGYEARSVVQNQSPIQFTGTFSTNVQQPWVGQYTAEGLILNGLNSGLVEYDFTNLTAGYLPANSLFIFGDVDRGSTLDEKFELYDAVSTPVNNAVSGRLESPWFDSYAMRGPGTGSGGTILAGNMPSYSWLNNIYTITGENVVSNPNVAVSLRTLYPLFSLTVDKNTTHNGMYIAAPLRANPVPEPSSCMMMLVGVVGFFLLQRGRRVRSSDDLVSLEV